MPPAALPPAFLALAAACARATGADVAVDPEVPGLAEAARRHRVAAPVLALLGLPDAAAARRLAALRNAQASVAIVRALEAAGIRAIVLKGAVLAQRLYGDPSARDSKDVDILVAPGDMAGAQAVLAERFAAAPSRTTQSAREAALIKDVSLTSATLGLEIELHRRLFDVPGLIPRTFDSLWAARAVVRIGGVDVPALGLIDEALFLIGHGASSSWFRLKWVQDIARLLRILPDDTAARIADEAARLRVEAMVGSAIDVARLLPGTPVPVPLTALPDSADRRALTAAARSALIAAEAEYMDPGAGLALRRVRDQLRLRRDGGYRRAVIAATIASPSDRAQMPLPGWAWPLYLPAKPLLRAWRRRAR